jgi:mono/diheme cytochrome c family protein/DNA-binding beta-propeller fold protein YncE
MRRLALAILAAAVGAKAQDENEATLSLPETSARQWAPFVEPDFPFFNSELDARDAGPGFPADNLTPRGIVLQLGQGAWVCFDTDLLRVSAAWTGGAVTAESMAQSSYLRWWHKSTEGEAHLPKPAGPVWLANGIYPGWQTGERPSVVDPRTPAPSAAEVGRGAVAPALARFGAIRLAKGGVELDYSVAGAPVRERIASDTSAPAFPSLRRDIEMGPSSVPLLLILAHQSGTNRLTASVSAPSGPPLPVLEEGGLQYVRIPPHGSALSFSVSISPAAGRRSQAAPGAAGGGDRLRWPQEVTTNGHLSSSVAAYVVDNIDLPLANPWRRNVRPADVQFFPDGSAAVVTIDGDVWKVSGLGGRLDSIRWRRFASGFNEPLGLAIRGGEIFVFDRDGIWRVADTAGRGEADLYELFSNAFSQTAESRDYAAGIKLAPDGSFVISKGGIEEATMGKDNGTVLRVSADGKSVQRLGWGFRNPLIGVDPQTGLVTASDQEGNYVPATPLYIVEGDRYHGYLPSFAPHEVYPAPIEEPLTWIPHNVCPSAVTQTWLRGARMGPLNDSLVLVSYYFPELFRVLVGRDGGRTQGAVVSITRDFRFSPLNAAVNPADGFLYAAGLQIFGTAADQVAGMGRVRYTGIPSPLARAVTPVAGGVVVDFDSAVDPAAVRPESFVVERWDYRRSYTYGSLHYLRNGSVGQESMNVSGASLSRDGRRVFIAVPAMSMGYMQMAVKWTLRSASGAEMPGAAYFTPWSLGSFEPGADERLALSPQRVAGPTAAGQAAAATPLVEQGRRLAEAFGCIACHSADGSARAGPTWKGLFGQRVEFANGSDAVADEAYIRAHLRPHPNAVVRGFAGGMPDYTGLVTPDQAAALVEYIRSVR